MLPWLHLQNLHFSESGMEVISIQENYFCESNFAEFSTIENFSEPMMEPSPMSLYLPVCGALRCMRSLVLKIS